MDNFLNLGSINLLGRLLSEQLVFVLVSLGQHLPQKSPELETSCQVGHHLWEPQGIHSGLIVLWNQHLPKKEKRRKKKKNYVWQNDKLNSDMVTKCQAAKVGDLNSNKALFWKYH